MEKQISSKDVILNNLRKTYKTNMSISGEELSNILNVSRTTIWKYINEFKKMGYEIRSSTNKGYQLISIPDKLYNEEVQILLKTHIFGRNYYYYDSVDSTNNVAKLLADQGANEGTVILAEHQTAGKGRMGRYWLSPNNKGLYFSIIVKPQLPVYKTPLLTLVIATAVADTLNNNYKIKAKIKWPNDIIVNRKKICGILIEMSADMDHIKHMIIGIGINVNTDDKDLSSIHNSYEPSSMLLETDNTICRKELLADLLLSIEYYYNEFILNGFENLRKVWEMYAASIGQEITVNTNNNIIKGVLLGIDSTGALLISIDNKTQKIYQGEIII